MKCADKIEIRPVVGGNMADQPFFKKYLTPNLKNIVSPNASLIHQNGLYFGNNPELTQQEIAEIISIFTQ